MLLNKKLTIAVLTFGLLLTLGSAAFSSDAPKQPTPDYPLKYETFNPNAPKLHDLKMVGSQIEAFDRPISGKLLATPTTVLPPDAFCDFIDYSGGMAYYYWTLPDPDYPIENYLMRISPEPGYTCTLLTVCIGVYGTAIVGTPSMWVLLYDAGRNPVDSILVPFAQLPPAGSMGYVCADFSTLNGGGPFIYVDGEEFWIGCAVSQSDPGDVLAFLSDDGSSATGRHCFALWGGWYAWTGDYAFLFGADVCCARIPFTDCYRQDYDCNAYYYWPQPDPYGDDFFNMRFTASGPETLMAVGVCMYNAPGTFEPIGDPDLDIFVWGDDGAGFPDLSNVIYSTTIPYASIVYYPAYNHVDVSALNIVLPPGDFHVGWSTNDVTGGVLAGISDDGSCGTGRSSELYIDTWGTILNDWGVDVNFWIYADLCRDEFADCRNINYYGSPAIAFYAPDRYGDIGYYVKFTPFGEGCRLENFWYALYWPGSHAGPPWDHYSQNSQLQVFDIDGGNDLPGTLLGSIDLTAPGDYFAVPGYYAWNYRSFHDQNIRFDTDVWCGIESFATDTLQGIRVLADAWDSNPLMRSCENWVGFFGYMIDDWAHDCNFLMNIDVCCVPFPEFACVPGEDWPTYALNFSRTNHTGNSIGDAQCDLTKDWEQDLGQVMAYCSPVIWKDTIVGVWLDRIAALDINTGNIMWTKYAGDWGGFVLASGLLVTPTVYNFDDYGVFKTYVYVSGGGSRAMSAFDIATGDTVWSRGFFVHGTNTFSFGITVILDIEGTPVLYYASDDGDVYAVNALTGAEIWTVNVGGNVGRGVSTTTSGDILIVGRDLNVTNGDVIALDPANGAQIWSLYDANGGLPGATIVPAKDYPGGEYFTGGISYDAASNQILAPSYYDIADNTTPVADGGVIYAIDASSGVVNWVNLATGGFGNGTAAPALDASTVITIAWCPWIATGQRRGPQAFSISSGAELWYNTTDNPGVFVANEGGYRHNWYMDGILSCEPEGAPDIYIATNRDNYLNFFDADNGEQLWHRRFDGGGVYSQGHRVGVVIDDGHVLVPWRSTLVCLTNQSDRQRLEINDYNAVQSVEFGMTSSENLTYEEMFSNSGCAPLTVNNIYLDDIENGTWPEVPVNSIGRDRVERMEKELTKMGDEANNLVRSISELSDIATSDMRLSRSLATYAPPSWINSIVSPTPGTVINPGSPPVDIVINVDATSVTRGLHEFYAYIDTDDPDYFLNYAYMDDPGDYQIPVVKLAVQGGCLYATIDMEFGDVAGGNPNIARIWNSGKLGDGDELSLQVDGDGGSFWQAGVVIGVSKRRVAFHSDNWHGDPYEFRGLLGDTQCDDPDDCEMEHEINALLGYISTDQGASYDPVYGEVVTYSFVDSIPNYFDSLSQDPAKWNWEYEKDNGFPPPYDDTLSLGLKACAKAIGVYDVPRLSNFVLFRYALFSRYGAEHPNMHAGAFIDYDVKPGNAYNMMGYDSAHSLAFCYDCATPDRGFGMVKIPFGGGYEPLYNARTLAAIQAAWNDSDIWFDSLWHFMSNDKFQLIHHASTIPCNPDPNDRDAFIAFGKFPLTASDSTIICFANFGKVDGVVDGSDASEYFDIATSANRWCGFDRGDVNDDGVIDLVDIIFLANYIGGGNGPYPFEHLGDVNADGTIDGLDVDYLIAYYFSGGPDPLGDWTL
ncbi:MAG: PQQ-binding-like beta-propeller repeat protein [Candidatus Zixiibacteriota bacterium]|nr:MAG: PQQ-binding-like beta-propeller repeat protein [candidate division Zixibacteria bacterium]